MNREQLLAHWARLEALLTQVLKAEQHHLAVEHAEQVRKFIDHNEFGLAFEWLKSAFTLSDVPADEQSVEAMREAARMMEL